MTGTEGSQGFIMQATCRHCETLIVRSPGRRWFHVHPWRRRCVRGRTLAAPRRCEGSGWIVRRFQSHHERCPGCPDCEDGGRATANEMYLRLLRGKATSREYVDALMREVREEREAA